eukprot:6206847-Pleurochrysis_carterae.AAC.5
MPRELEQPRRAPPLLRNWPLNSIEAFRNAEHSCSTLGDGPLSDGTHGASPYFAARMHAANVARQQPQTSQVAERCVPQRYRQQQTQLVPTPARATHAPPNLGPRCGKPGSLYVVAAIGLHLDAGTGCDASHRCAASNGGVQELRDCLA